VLCVAVIVRRGCPLWWRVSISALLLPLAALLFSLSYWLPLSWRTSDDRLDALARALEARGIFVITTLGVDGGATREQFEPWFRYHSEEAQWIGRSPAFETPGVLAPDLAVESHHVVQWEPRVGWFSPEGGVGSVLVVEV